MFLPLLRVLWGITVVILPPAILGLGNMKAPKRDWDYALLGISANTSNPEMLQWNLYAERVGRGKYSISGEAIVNCDVNDEYFIEALLYRSASGSNVYRLEPFKVEKQTMPHFMANTYKDLLAESLLECSNAPQSDGDNPPTFEKTVYTFNKCDISIHLLPSHMETGFYKLYLIGSGVVEFYVEFQVQVDRKF